MIIQVLPIASPNAQVATEFLVTIRGSAQELSALAEVCIAARSETAGVVGTVIPTDGGVPMRVIVDRKGPPLQGN